MAQAQQHILYYDPNLTGGTALGGSGAVWTGPNWWNGSADQYWDGQSSMAFSGTPGTLTPEAEVDCGPSALDANPSIYVHTDFTLNLNGFKFNFNDANNYIGVFIDSGVTFNITNVQNGVSGQLAIWGNPSGLAVVGDGSPLPYSQFGVGVIQGNLEVHNDTSGAGAFGWYTAVQGGTVTGTGNLSDAPTEMSYVNGAPTISPGPRNGTGTLLINSTLKELDNTPSLSFNLGGLNQGAVANGYSWLKVNGTVTLDLQYVPASSIRLKLINGFIPSLGDHFDVITCSNFVFTAGAGGSGVADLTYNLPILPGLAWSESIVTNGGLQSLRFTVVLGTMLPPPPAPLAYLNFDHNLMDQTGNGHNGVFVSTNAGYSASVPTPAAGEASLAVPGDNSTAVSLTNTTGISEDDAQSFTISVWFRCSNSSDYPNFVTCSNPDTNAPINYVGWLGLVPSGKLTYGVFDVFNLSSSTFVADGNWHHAVVVHDGTAYSYQLYVDGVPDGFTYQTGTDQGANLWDVTIATGFLAAGNVDEVAYWNQALTAAQVATVYYLGPVPGAPALSISPSAGNVSLSWLLGGYTLQQNTSLTSPGNWTDLGTNSPVTLPVGTGSEFFRLKSSN